MQVLAIVCTSLLVLQPAPESTGEGLDGLLEPLELPRRLEIASKAPLTLKDVLESIESTHPKLSQSRQKLRQSEGKLLSAQGGFDLSLSLDGQASPPPSYYDWFHIKTLLEQPVPILGLNVYGGWRLGLDFDGDNSAAESDIEIPDYDANFETFNGGEVFGGLSLNLLKDRDIDLVRKTLWQAERGVEASEATLQGDRLNLALKAAEAYWGWVASGQIYIITANLLDLAVRRERQVAEQFKLGAKSRFNLLESHRSTLKRASALVKAQRKLEKDAIKLSLSFRARGSMETQVPPPSRLPPQLLGSTAQTLTMNAALRAALDRRPELEALEATLEQAEIESRFADNSFAPKVEVGVEVSKDLGRLTNDPDNFSSQSSLEPTVIKTKLKVQLPVPFREARGKQASARAARTQIRERIRALRDQITAEVRDAYSALRNARQTLQIARLAATAAEAVAEAERERFELGEVDLLSVNLREQQAADAQTTAALAAASLQLAYARIRAAAAINPAEW